MWRRTEGAREREKEGDKGGGGGEKRGREVEEQQQQQQRENGFATRNHFARPLHARRLSGLSKQLIRVEKISSLRLDGGDCAETAQRGRERGRKVGERRQKKLSMPVVVAPTTTARWPLSFSLSLSIFSPCTWPAGPPRSRGR